MNPLVVPVPGLDAAHAATIAREHFGVPGTASRLGGERDRNFRIDADGTTFLLKVSNPADEPAVLDLQNQALAHLARQDPDLPVMRLVTSTDGTDAVTVAAADGTPCLARLFTWLPGRTATPAQLDRAALEAYGGVVARAGRALRGFFHPAGRYDILWDLRHTARLRDLVDQVTDPHRRAVAERALDRFDHTVAPAFDGLRAQIVHNDLTLDNVLLGADDRVCGIVDVGDLTHTALVCDLAIAVTSLMQGREDPIEAAEAAITGYVGVVPLEDDEAGLVADLVAARLVALGVIAAWRVGAHPDNAAYITAGEDEAWALLMAMEAVGVERVARRLRVAASGRTSWGAIPTPRLLDRRRRVLGRSPLSYREPLHLVAGDGVWLFDPHGRRYLDAYNNVPVVGHAHPAVTAAVAAQARRLATNTRYLHEAVVLLAERLVASLPAGLDTVLVVNSGSEANDLAWRLATAATGRRGAIVSDWAYHGITAATTALSPEAWPPGFRPDHVETIPPPGGDADAASTAVAGAVAALEARDLGLAALVADPAFTSDGVVLPAPDALRATAAAVHAAGGLLVVDEVQAGHGRLGHRLWSFATAGVVPDVVTMGKPMGNGHPVAALVTRRELADALTAEVPVFSTFGGNPVACAAALAVLDVIERDGLLVHVAEVGDVLRTGLHDLAAAHGTVGGVRGRGLLAGVEMVADRAPAPARAAAVVQGLRHRGVLVGSTGRHDHVLKIRPPLVFEPAHVGLLLQTLDDVLTEVARTGGDPT